MRAVLLTLLVCSCDAAAASGLEVALGSAGSDGLGYRPLADDEDLPMIFGAQGGFHVWVAIRVRGLAGTQPIQITRIAAYADTGEEIFRTNEQLTLQPIDAEWSQTEIARPLYLCPSAGPIDGRTLAVRVVVRTLDGHTAAASRRIIPRCDLSASPTECRTTCTP